ncbi:hydrolase [Roseococcus sp. SDR]|uniref:hydrolase n=1 Tax=Roseococcus sp. SDR TaxID=2835532 RepID=UPI001BD18DD9|nr:hydrolase [Roseococcus sp. SDR]MBS7792194.1 hydrolase [Roseococcus sp. SDR]MBV1847508.1 hydrolase [Roseococcus sp. SDR]
MSEAPTTSAAPSRMPPAHGAWMQMHSGFCVDLLEPDLAELTLRDLATCLSRLPRFLGHTRGGPIYSVAQHCVLMAQMMAEEPLPLRRAVLLHDAHEAMIGDIISPVKKLLGPALVDVVERPIIAAIHARFGLAEELIGHPAIKRADLQMLAAEKRDLLAPSAWPWPDLPSCDHVPQITPWQPADAYWRFLNATLQLGIDQ